MALVDDINAIGNLHITVKWFVCFLVTLLVILYFINPIDLFSKLLMILIPFLIGTSVNLASTITKTIS